MLETVDPDVAARVRGELKTPRMLRREVIALSENPFSHLEMVEVDDYPETLGNSVSVSIPNNTFLRSAMQKLGGGEQRMLSQLDIYERRGGGLEDGLKIVRLHDRAWKEPVFTHPASEMVDILGIKNMSHVPLEVARSTVKHNLDANPGPTYKALGFQSKRESVGVAWDVARAIYEAALSGPVVNTYVPRYALSGRSKLDEKTKFSEKLMEGKSLGRAVWMADQHEQYVGAIFSQPLTERFIDGGSPIQIGFNKFGQSPERVCAELSKYNTYINVDFSKFDQTVSPGHIKYVFDIVRHAFNLDPSGQGQGSRILDWIEDEFTNTRLVLPTGRVVLVRGGVPSGSCLTAIIDSMVATVVLWQVLTHLKFKFALFVQGDDAIIGINCDGNDHDRTISGRKIAADIADLVSIWHGLKMNADKCDVSTRLFVGIAQPKLDRPIRDASTAAVREYRNAERERLGRPLRMNEKFTFLKEEPVGPAPGHTHRWTYLFAGRAKFLSHYFKEGRNGVEMVRPTSEVVVRLLCPENRVKNIDDHFMRLASTLAEHLGNHHVTNRIMHYAYDAYLLKKAGIYTAKDMQSKRLYSDRFDQSLVQKRAWYRKVDYVVDLLESDQDFKQMWQKLFETAVYLHGQTYGMANVDWSLVRALRRGKPTMKGTGSTFGAPTPSRVDEWQTGVTLRAHQRVTFAWMIYQSSSLRKALSQMTVSIFLDPHFIQWKWGVYHIQKFIRDVRKSGRELEEGARCDEWD